MKEFKAGKLNVKVLKDRAEVGIEGARDIAAAMRDVIAKKGALSMVFASAASQNEMLTVLAQDPSIDWTRVTAFNMDEYIGISREHPETFGNYLKRMIYNQVKPARVELFDTEAADPQAECDRYAKLLEEYPPDIVLFGVGETCHLAFNDPPYANFNDPVLAKLVEIDEASQHQMVHDGCFEDYRQVPKKAYTITVPVVMNAPRLFGMVPGSTKADAIYNTVNQPISTAYPATVLRNHPCATMYIDLDSAVKLDL